MGSKNRVKSLDSAAAAAHPARNQENQKEGTGVHPALMGIKRNRALGSNRAERLQQRA